MEENRRVRTPADTRQAGRQSLQHREEPGRRGGASLAGERSGSTLQGGAGPPTTAPLEEPPTPSPAAGRRRPGNRNAPGERPPRPQTVRAEGHGLAAPPQGLSWGSSGRTRGRWPLAAQVTLGRGPPRPASDAGKSLRSPPARPRGLVLWPDLFSPSLTSRL